MSQRTLTILVDADEALCGCCEQQPWAGECDIFGELKQLRDDFARHPDCVAAESLSRKALAVVEAARHAPHCFTCDLITKIMYPSDDPPPVCTCSHAAVTEALSDYDSTKGGSDG